MTPEESQETYAPFCAQCNINEKSQGKLSKYSVSVKDALWVKGVESAAASEILKGFKPLEHSTAVAKTLAAGGTIIGKATQDEFGFGSFCTHTKHIIPKNPADISRCAGGSSGGCAVASATIANHVSIAESTGGSIVTPASFCGVVGITPSYGRVSRHGLISYASSLDKIGTMGTSVEDAALLLEVISGVDEKDETSSNEEVEEYSKVSQDEAPQKIAVLKVEGVDADIMKRFDEVVEKLKSQGKTIEEISLPNMKKFSLAAYYIIAMSEASSHLACLSGLRYGASKPLTPHYESYFKEVREAYFGEEAKRRILLGTFMRMSGYRGKYYTKALQVRELIREEYNALFEKYDVIISPTTPTVAPKFEDIDKLTPMQHYAFDFLTVGVNLAGLPHMSVPIQREGELPQGFMITASLFEEKKMIALGKLIEVIR